MMSMCYMCGTGDCVGISKDDANTLENYICPSCRNLGLGE